MISMKKVYKYRLDNIFTFQLPEYVPGEEIKLSPLINISASGLLTVQPGFLWNGCDWKINILDIWIIGTPDGIINPSSGLPLTYYASMVHDILCKYKEKLPFTKKYRADVFYSLCTDFKLAKFYHRILKRIGT